MVDDGRTYIRVHDGMPDHPKVVALSDRAFRVLIETWCWNSRHLTDGLVPEAAWKRRTTPKIRRELTEAGLFEEVRVGGDVQTHDYLQHQRSRATVEEISETRRAERQRAAAQGNHNRWHMGPGRKPNPDCLLCREALQSNEKPSRNGSQVDRRPIADRDRGDIATESFIGIGIGRERVELGGEGPDSNTSDSSDPPAPIFDPDNPRCARHSHIAPGQHVPRCRDCAEVRRQALDLVAEVEADDERIRRAHRAAIDACDACDDNGLRDAESGVARCDHEPDSAAHHDPQRTAR